MRLPLLHATAVAITLAATALPRAQMTNDPDATRRAAQAKRLLERAPLIDGHNDIPWRMREQKPRYDFDVFDLRQPRPTFHTDISRVRAGGLGGQFWSRRPARRPTSSA
jgi:membrane dipeptidase